MLKNSEIVAILEKTEDGDKRLCRAIVHGWKDVLDHDGQDVPFTEGMFEALLDEFGVATQIATQYFAALKGSVEKN